MVATFNAVAFQSRIDKAAGRAVKASVRSADTDQRITKRKDRLTRSLHVAKKNDDDALRTALVDKVTADIGMAECDQKKAALNALKLSAYVRQLEREAVLKAERAQKRAEKAAKGPTAWGFRTPDGTVTPLANTDGSFGRLVGRSKAVMMGTETFAFLCGNPVVDLINDVGGVIVCNEMTYGVEVNGDTNTVTLKKV